MKGYMMDTLYKDELVTKIADMSGYTKKDTEVFLETLIGVFGECAKEGVLINYKGWGQLDFALSKGGKHRFSQDSEMIQYPDSVSLTFKLSKNLRDLAKDAPKDSPVWDYVYEKRGEKKQDG
jgi:DNA-binding protein HU-beta